MPRVDGVYKWEKWYNNSEPAITAEELNDMCETLEKVPIENGGTGVNSLAELRALLGLGADGQPLPIASGGTGATTSSGALNSLGGLPSANVKSKGNATTPVYFDVNGAAQPITSYSGTSEKANKLSAGAGTSTKPVYFDANGNAQPISSYSGTATTAKKLSKSAGSSNVPVYFADGVPVEMPYVSNEIIDLEISGSEKTQVRLGRFGKVVTCYFSSINTKFSGTFTGKIPEEYRPAFTVQCAIVGINNGQVASHGRLSVETNGNVVFLPSGNTNCYYQGTLCWVLA